MADDLSISVSLRSFAADMDDRDECTREDRDMLRAAADEIERITAERDEARRMVCELLCNPPERLVEGICALPEECADIRQWDCFKENTNG